VLGHWHHCLSLVTPLSHTGGKGGWGGPPLLLSGCDEATDNCGSTLQAGAGVRPSLSSVVGEEWWMAQVGNPPMYTS